MIFRTKAQKADKWGSWLRGDRAFFAAGACHVLAHEFLKREENHSFYPIMVLPDAGFRGGHVFVTDNTTVFDYHGSSQFDVFVSHYLRKIKRFFPGWRGTFLDISDSFWSDEWFIEYQFRRPQQFHLDPTERANRFIDAKNSPTRRMHSTLSR